jgi:hypothetical protein
MLVNKYLTNNLIQNELKNEARFIRNTTKRLSRKNMSDYSSDRITQEASELDTSSINDSEILIKSKFIKISQMINRYINDISLRRAMGTKGRDLILEIINQTSDYGTMVDTFIRKINSDVNNVLLSINDQQKRNEVLNVINKIIFYTEQLIELLKQDEDAFGGSITLLNQLLLKLKQLQDVYNELVNNNLVLLPEDKDKIISIIDQPYTFLSQEEREGKRAEEVRVENLVRDNIEQMNTLISRLKQASNKNLEGVYLKLTDKEFTNNLKFLPTEVQLEIDNNIKDIEDEMIRRQQVREEKKTSKKASKKAKKTKKGELKAGSLLLTKKNIIGYGINPQDLREFMKSIKDEDKKKYKKIFKTMPIKFINDFDIPFELQPATTLEGSGLFDVFDKVLSLIPPGKLKKSDDFLNQIGNDKINNMIIYKTPLQKFVNIGMKILGAKSIDEFFHIGLYCNNDIVIEKSNAVRIDKYNPIENNTLTMNIDLSGRNITYRELMENTRKYMGDQLYYSYNKINNNCGIFITAILTANNLMRPEYKQFLYQDMSKLDSELKPTSHKIIDRVMDMANKIGARLGFST